LKYYRITLETGKKGSNSRTLYTKQKDIIGAMDISNKIKKSKLDSIKEISQEQYDEGVASKYD